MVVRQRGTGQAMVELALALPIFLMVVYGLLEAGRYIFMIQAVTSAAREAARYASAAGLDDSGHLHYQNCAGIRDAARKVGFLLNLSNSDISVNYDNGSGTSKGTCPSGSALNTSLTLSTGDRAMVTVQAQYRPVLPLFLPFTAFTINETSRRTLTGTIDLNK